MINSLAWMPKEHYKGIKSKILECLKDGPRTTEEIRVFVCETRSTLYPYLHDLRKEGIIQSNRPKKQSQMMKWRIKP